MRSKAYGLLYLLLSVAAVLIVLMVLNWLPTMLQKDMMRRFNSLDEVQSKLNIRELQVPSYFPQSIMWPPSEILAQAKPYPAVLMIFNDVNTRAITLVISQGTTDAFSANTLIPFVRVTRKVPLDLKTRKAILEVGTCKDDEPCSRLSWTENNFRTVITMKSEPFELIRIAESMIP